MHLRSALSVLVTALTAIGCGDVGSAGLPEVEVPADIPLGAPLAPPAGPGQLQMALVTAQRPTRFRLAPGHHILQPFDWTDPTCGNCEDPDTPVPATLSLQLRGVRMELVGASPDSVFLHTGAGYGLLIEDCTNCVVRGVTITGGARDPDGRATNGAVVVRRSTARLDRCRIRDNIGDSATVAQTVVGVAGVVGREGASIEVTGCEILRNSWDGIALYRGARARIHDNIIDGVDKARGAAVGGGRGVGIGLTWDAEAQISGNLVTRYWKGIGVFADAQATIRYNVVEDVLTWGLAYWGAGEGRAAARMEENIVYQTGACGVMVSRQSGGDVAPGFLRSNIIVATGQDERYDSGEPYCAQRPIARADVPEGFAVEGNVLHDNRQPGDAWPLEDDLDEPAFRAALAPLLQRLSERPRLRESAFLERFGGR